ncbi:MAG: hypothetical protein ACXQT4_01635 [Methanotrichaceae archaeon]
MYKRIFGMGVAIILLIAGMALAEETNDVETTEAGNVTTIQFTGTAVELYESDMMGAPTIWKVNVSNVVDGPEPCSDLLNVTVSQALAPPWGSWDRNVTAEDEVAVYGEYLKDESVCSVTLQGSEDYYFELTEDETGTATEDETGTATEDETGTATEDETGAVTEDETGAVTEDETGAVTS